MAPLIPNPVGPPSVTVPAQSPEPAATPEQASGGPIRMFAINRDTTWKDLFDAFSADEQSCIRNILGDEQLESVLGRRLMSEATSEQLDAGLQDCLAPETAAGIILSAFIGQMEGLPAEAEACMRGLIADADAAVIAAGTRPGADSAAANAALEFIFGLLVCVPGQGPPGSAGPPSGSPQADGPQLWRYGTGGWVVNAPTIANGAIYVGSDDHHVYSLDAQTGALRWRFETGDIIRSSPTVTGGAVYVGSNDNHVYALDAGTGALLWQHDTGGWVQYSPVVNGGKVYLGARSDGDYKVHALDALSGAPVWVAECLIPWALSSPSRLQTESSTRGVRSANSMPWTQPPGNWSGATALPGWERNPHPQSPEEWCT